MEGRDNNAGVHSNNGFALQKNIALYILLSDYMNKFKDANYFICLEHHDDFLFCFLDNNQHCERIDVYQSKKTSSYWTINNKLDEILNKLLETGSQLQQDKIPKTAGYHHNLHFTSNSPIKLIKKEKGKRDISTIVNEANCLICFKDINIVLQNIIKERLSKLPSSNISELNNLHFLFVDINKTHKEQKNLLIGQINTLFGHQINDASAAVETILSLFTNIENVFNQGNKVKLLDVSKRVTSQEINQAINLITSKSKAFDYWRSQERQIREILRIKHADGDTFSYMFQTSFDLFKSIENQSHRMILRFVQDNYCNTNSLHLEEIIQELYDLFLRTNNNYFNEIETKAIMYAAYFEATNNKGLKNGKNNKV